MFNGIKSIVSYKAKRLWFHLVLIKKKCHRWNGIATTFNIQNRMLVFDNDMNGHYYPHSSFPMKNVFEIVMLFYDHAYHNCQCLFIFFLFLPILYSFVYASLGLLLFTRIILIVFLYFYFHFSCIHAYTYTFTCTYTFRLLVLILFLYLYL